MLQGGPTIDPGLAGSDPQAVPLCMEGAGQLHHAGDRGGGKKAGFLVMGQEALEEEKRRNLERYGNITVPQAEAARIAAQNFMRGFG